jgi:AbrB family looped-hinge helix DNA binding protein
MRERRSPPYEPFSAVVPRAKPEILNQVLSYYEVGEEVPMLKVRLSSRGQLALPKEVRDQLGLDEGDCLTVRVQGDEGGLAVSGGRTPPGDYC